MSGLFVAARFERGGSVVVPACAAQIGRGPSRDHPVAAHSPILPSGSSAPHTDLKALHPFLRGARGITQPLLTHHVS